MSILSRCFYMKSFLCLLGCVCNDWWQIDLNCSTSAFYSLCMCMFTCAWVHVYVYVCVNCRCANKHNRQCWDKNFTFRSGGSGGKKKHGICVSFPQGFEELLPPQVLRNENSRLPLIYFSIPTERELQQWLQRQTATRRDVSYSNCHLCLGNKHQTPTNNPQGSWDPESTHETLGDLVSSSPYSLKHQKRISTKCGIFTVVNYSLSLHVFQFNYPINFPHEVTARCTLQFTARLRNNQASNEKKGRIIHGEGNKVVTTH